jgi:calreticulin
MQDPKAVKPEEWDEREKIPDPEDKKPEGWDDIPATIVDPDAKKPGVCCAVRCRMRL